MKALVTGATGFLGRHLVQRLLQEGEEVWALARTSQPAAFLQGPGVRVVEGDVRRWLSLRQAVQGADVVFHCAGKTEPTGRWVDFLEVNVLGTERVIQAALEHGVRRIVHVSSIGVYGPRPPGVVIAEDDGYDPNPRARGFYTQSKIEADRVACWYAVERAAPVTVIRPGTIYGPGGKGGLVRAGLRLGPVNVVFGDGHNLLPLVYVANVVDALVLAGRSEATRGRAYNIVDDDEVSQRLYVERMGSALGLQQSTVYLPLPAVFAEKGSEVQATHQSDPRQGSSRPAHAPSPLPVFGPERHGRSPLNSGSSARNAQGHDVGFAQQAQRLIEQLDKSRHAQPWLIVASFLSPHDITLYRLLANLSGAFASDVEDVVPRDLFDPVRFQQMRHDDLTTKPGCQASYPMWMQLVADRERYSRFYYQLHKNVDEQMMVAYQALRNSRFRDDTIVIFTPDHGDLLGSHADMHQKWYTAYHEAIRVPRARGL